MEIVVVLRR